MLELRKGGSLVEGLYSTKVFQQAFLAQVLMESKLLPW